MMTAYRSLLTFPGLLICVVAVTTPAWAADKPAAKAVEWYNAMDYGPVLDDTIASPAPENNMTVKGHAVRLTSHGGVNAVVGGMCFDADLVRMSSGWSGGFLTLKGVAYDGAHGVTGPLTAGTQIFGTPVVPGWSTNDQFTDTRSEPSGPIPAAVAKFKGQYIHGDQVVFSYTVGTGTVLDLPTLEADGAGISRTFQLGHFPVATMLVAELQNGTGGKEADLVTLTGKDSRVVAGLIDAPAGVALTTVGNRILLTVPALDKATFKLVLSNAANAADAAAIMAQSRTIVQPDTLTTGGPLRYPEVITTKGSLGSNDGVYAVDTITVPEDNPYKSKMRFGGFDFFSDGRAAISTWNGDVWIVSGIDDTLGKLTWKRFATGLHQPLGLKIVNDEVYVTTRDGIERLVDLNHDGEADFYEAFNNDVHTSSAFHEFAFDLWTDQSGNFYYTKAGPVRAGGRGFEKITEHSGCMFKVSKDGATMEVIATGLRAPNGMSVGPKGEITCGDNEGSWTPSSRVNLVTQGGFYGVPPLSHRVPEPTDYDKPILWIPHNGPNVVDNSCGGQVWVLGDKWGLPAGTLLHMSYGTCSLFSIAWSKQSGLPQGGCVRFPLTFNTGLMRGRFNAGDGQLYLCGLRGWQTSGSNIGGFQRVRYTGKTVNLPVGYLVEKNGISLTFTNPLDPEIAGNKENYGATQWNYVWSANYGSPEVHVDDPKKTGHDPIEITNVIVSKDHKQVFLEMPLIRPVMQMKISYKIAAADGTPIQADFYNTVNALGDRPGP